MDACGTGLVANLSTITTYLEISLQMLQGASAFVKSVYTDIGTFKLQGFTVNC